MMLTRFTRWMVVSSAVCTVVLAWSSLASAEAHAGASSNATSSVQKIVYADYNGGIWIVKADGSGLHEISTVTADSVSFSPDGKKVAYTTGYGGLWTVPVTGGAARKINVGTSFIEDVAWSPNGKWLAYTADGSTGPSTIYRVPPGGGSVQRLSFAGKYNCSESDPAWSPDSGTISYLGAPSGPTPCGPGGVVVQRIGHPGKLVVPGDGLREASFTPTGNLVYVTPCQDIDVCDDVVVTYESNVDGSDQTLVDGVDHDCRGGNLCQNAVIGMPRGRGWVQEFGVIPDEIDVPETCFQGGYQKAGTVTETSPSFCVQHAEAGGYDVA